jgi:hypothetical protein
LGQYFQFTSLILILQSSSNVTDSKTGGEIRLRPHLEQRSCARRENEGIESKEKNHVRALWVEAPGHIATTAADV